jgi:hypothetical protein
MKGRKVWLILVVWILQLLAHTPLDHCWHHRVNLALEQEPPHLDPHSPLVFFLHIAHLETIEKPSPYDDPPKTMPTTQKESEIGQVLHWRHHNFKREHANLWWIRCQK